MHTQSEHALLLYERKSSVRPIDYLDKNAFTNTRLCVHGQTEHVHFPNARKTRSCYEILRTVFALSIRTDRPEQTV